MNDMIKELNNSVNSVEVLGKRSSRKKTTNMTIERLGEVFELGNYTINKTGWKELNSIDVLEKGTFEIMNRGSLFSSDPYLINMMYKKYDFVKKLFNITKYIIKTCYTIDGNVGICAQWAVVNDKSLLNDDAVKTDTKSNPYIEHIFNITGLSSNQQLMELYKDMDINLNALRKKMENTKDVHIYYTNALLMCQLILNVSVNNIGANIKKNGQ